MTVKIQNLDRAQKDLIEQVANFLPLCFAKYSPTWLPDADACYGQISASFEGDRRSRVAINSDGKAIGWIGAITDNDCWELHPIAVAPGAQRRGVGQALVRHIESLAIEAGAVSIWAGTGDETGATSLSKVDLYADPANAIANLETPPDHPVNFWNKMGYTVVGVLPDEEGLGRPGIHLARRLV